MKNILEILENFSNINIYTQWLVKKMTQRTNSKHNKILSQILYLLNSNICWMVIKYIFMAITLNFYIVVNKNYLYNYIENIKV